jgi:hypothetical protein
VSDAVEDCEEIINWRELEQPFAELAAFQDFCLEQDFPRGRGEDETLADCDLSARANEGAPKVFASVFGFGVSHACARVARRRSFDSLRSLRMTKGWGTEHFWCDRFGEHYFDAAGWLLVVAKQGAAGVEARGDHAAVVEH